MLMNSILPGKTPLAYCITINHCAPEDQVTIWEISLGSKTDDIARGLFAALRELDSKSVDTIFVEGIGDEGDIAAAVMNRLRKAAEVKIK
jgi:L-threonylcarbamoyladenylate synthase